MSRSVALSHWGHRARALAPLLLAGALCLGGCAHHRQAAAVPPAAPLVPAASPGIRGQSHGLELWVWVISDPHAAKPEPEPATSPDTPDESAAPPPEAAPAPAATGGKPGKPPKPPPIRYIIKDERVTLEAALRPYLDRPVPVPADLRQRWRDCGLRAVAVPPADLPRIEASVRMVGAVQRQWLGEIPDWTDLIRGPQFDEGPVSGEERVMHLDAGRLRLLGRCWSVPGPGEAGAGLRLELVPQHQPRLSDAQRFASALEAPKLAEAQGYNFSNLALGVTITGIDALVIVPDAPGADWNQDTPPTSTQDALALFVPTIGERMLSTPPTGATPRTRAAIVLLPHPREKFELLP